MHVMVDNVMSMNSVNAMEGHFVMTTVANDYLKIVVSMVLEISFCHVDLSQISDHLSEAMVVHQLSVVELDEDAKELHPLDFQLSNTLNKRLAEVHMVNKDKAN
jgi:hypothetical protein